LRAPASTDRSGRPAARAHRLIGAVLRRAASPLTFVLLLGVWELACRQFNIPTFILPPPSMIVASVTELEPTRWFGHIWATLRVAILGYLASTAISIPPALALAASPILSRTLFPILVVVQSTPVVAVAPIIVVMLGHADLPRVVITFLITFFPIVVATATGLLATPREMIDLSRSLRAGTAREMLHIRLPYAVPYLFSALRISTTLAIIGAVVAEFVAAEQGLGYLIFFSTSFFKVPQAFAALTLLVALSLCFFRAVTLLQGFLFPWSLSGEQR
jgi:NitT/TauT family transport system permease protein